MMTPKGRITAFSLFIFASLLVTVPVMAQQQSRCADCHFSDPDSPEPYHLASWERSAHGRNSIGCENCHGGNPTTFESFLAHQDILATRNPASPAHRQNIPRTCGTCHPGPFVEFQKSRHFALLQEGNRDTPVCTTCHGNVAAQLLSPKGLASQCATCHGEEEEVSRQEYPAQGKQLLEGIIEVRALLDEARPLIRRVRNEARRERLQYTYDQAQVPLTEATVAGHAFVFETLQERLGVARRRAEALLGEVVNP